MRLIALSTCMTSIIFSTASFAQSPTPPQFINDAILPPIHAWQGKSETLLVSHDHPWVTPFEQQGYVTSPDYTQTMQWLDKLVNSSAKLQKVSLGKSPQGRDIWMIIASKEGAGSAQQLSKNNKATVLVQAGIHSGEIDGKDAGMMLLRDMAFGTKQSLLDNVNFLFIPILSVDAHERSTEYNRVNQRGPVNMGWRTTATNLNLNRDYAKADAPEMQHLIKAINQWQPDLYIDVHVTDGIDYQYDVTFGYNVKQGYSPSIFQWLEKTYRPQVESALTANDHIPAKLIFANDNTDMSQGVSYWNPSPRYSNGYGDARHLPTILIENHSLKPFKQRVLGTYVMLEQTLKTVANHADTLTAAIKQDQQGLSPQITLTWQNEPQPNWDFKGIDYRIEKSDISGADVVRWNGQPKLYADLPVIGNTKAGIQVQRPQAYYIPAQWTAVIDKLTLHGIEITTLNKPLNIRAEQYRFTEPQFAEADYESRQTVTAKQNASVIDASVPAGTVKVSTAQPLGDLAILLLEPQAEDSLFYWGFFNTIFTRTEYIEDYAVEPLAVKMLAENPSLKAEFELALQDKHFAKDSKARLRWFYERSPYYDAQYQVYPVLREISLEK
ncbi:M14 family metallopeptidase [Shewanella subflava]|uniref:M14 family metallopeptidase n=1 Tax=Shewanella subflava TaxID=2986476 RepID=A0ABT3I8Q3_9GAMM|nr:M14 family metallopeptidase [Shewanella subflava]MCW3172329.1 M14 family metallopeptidase [Shewanella subflava]